MTPILNALAAIVVWEPSDEVIAVAISLTGSKVGLIVSGNRGVKQTTIEFLHVVWQQLKDISSLYSKQRTGPPPDECDESPILQDPKGNDLFFKDTLYMLIPRFCMRKFEKRFFKYWGIISAFSSACKQWTNEQKHNDPGFTDDTADSFVHFAQINTAIFACSKRCFD